MCRKNVLTIVACVFMALPVQADVETFNDFTVVTDPSVYFGIDNVSFPTMGAEPAVSVYPPPPGVTPSEHYSFRVREVGSSQWLTPFAWITRCVDEATADSTHYFSHLADWTNTYANFEMVDTAPVEMEITKLD